MKLTISNLSKTYPNGTEALKNVNLEISTGMFGLLGPNGAGKSTLMRIIATLQEADEGSVKFGEIDIINQKNEIRKILGYLPQEFGVYPKMTAEEMLDHFALLKGVANTNERKELVKALLHQTNLYQVRRRKLGGYSGGMKQRFGIAQALIGNPQLIIVDEPTAGLDPAERHRFHNLLSEIGENIIIILSTHIVEDVSDLCSSMAIINQGKLLFSGSPIEMIKEAKGKVWKTTIEKPDLSKYQDNYNVISSRLFAGRVIIKVFSNLQPSAEFESSDPEMEDIYFSQVKMSETVKTTESV